MRAMSATNCITFLLPQVLFHCFVVAATNITTDQVALLAFKSKITGDPRNILEESWSTAAPICTWIGVICGIRHQRVTPLDLSHFGLEGTISPRIGDLSFIAYLSLRGNSFYGSLPRELAHLRRLKILDFGSNFLNGSIPSGIGNCTLLKEINLSENYFTGPIPLEIGYLIHLEIFKIDSNGVSGNIPSGLFNISTMKTFTAYGNSLSGSLPSTIGLYVPSLVELVLGRNEMDGIIPFSISNASKLTSLDLSDNLFIGSIPDGICNVGSLQRLNLRNNYLNIDPATPRTSFLSSLANCKKLSKLVLSGNTFDTTLPTSIGNLSSLQQLWANDCNIKGSIPREISNLTSLIALYLEDNELISELPATIGRLRKLQGLYLQGNNLEGTITNSVCQLDSLFELSLGGNKLSGSIPECLGNLTTLKHLNLSSNNITSIVPLTLWSLKDILSINMSSNFLTGSLSSSIKQLLVVVQIDFSQNKLSGEIPEAIGDLQRLIYLSLAKNELQGHIPQSLNHSLSMEFLDLSFNNLSGVIPKSLEALSYLMYFNVSYNRLQGEIPDGGPFGNFSAQSYMKNTGLCGARWLEVPPCEVGVPRSSKKKIPFLLKILLPTTAFVVVSSSLFIWSRRTSESNEILERSITFDDNAIERFTYEELANATGGFHEDYLIGKGSFGTVYKGEVHSRRVAIKVFDVEEARKELSIFVEFDLMLNPRLPRPSHKNLIKILGSVESDNFVALIMVYMVNGSLDDWLHCPRYYLDMVQRLDIMLDIASALEYLHHDYARIIVHCDLKPSNILLDEDMVAHVSDFSISQLLHPDAGETRGESAIIGTFGYVAPECGLQGIVSTKSDVYGFGIILMEAFTGKRPTDKMFGGVKSLRSWVMESLPHGIEEVMDPRLLQTEEVHRDARKDCFLNIMRLAYHCSTELPQERLDIKNVLIKLKKIKSIHLAITYLDKNF